MPTRRPPADHGEPPAAPPPSQELAVMSARPAAADEVPAVAARLGPRFARSDARGRAQTYRRGLLRPVARKNGWQLAEAAGDRPPYATPHRLGRADWDPDRVRDDVRADVVEHLGDPAAILVVDETGVVKQGTASAGGAQQYVGGVGKRANAQVGVFVAYASPTGVAFLDRALYLPQEWTDDPARRRQAGIPDTVGFATKPQRAQAMLERARVAGVPAAWVTADRVYGDDRHLRMWLEAQEQPLVLAVSGKEDVHVAATWTQRRVSTWRAELQQTVPADAWQRLSAGDGATGPRRYDWYRRPLVPPRHEGLARWCLVRRRLSDPDERRADVTVAPAGTDLATRVQVAGQRWTIAVAFAAAKGAVGRDQYEVRRWTGWDRHVTLALFAPALLTVVRGHLDLAAAVPTSTPGPPAEPQQTGHSQQAALSTPRHAERLGQGSLAPFRQQRHDHEGRWPRRATPPPAAPTPSSSPSPSGSP